MRLENVLHLVNCHTEGVVCDVVVGGLPKIPGDTVLAQKKYFEQHLDHLRTMLCLEPRANKIRSVNVLVPTANPDAQFGFLILETTEIVEMSGGNIISVATVLLETGMVPMHEPVTEFGLETAAGLVPVRCRCKDGKVLDVTFTNQPAFVLIRDALIQVPHLGELRVDVAWGGMWYLIVDAEDVGLKLGPAEHEDVVRLGELIKAAARDKLDVSHPTSPEFAASIQCTLFAGPLSRDELGTLRSKNAVVVSPGWIDRCPCGTGTSARLALMHARGDIAEGELFVHESLIGTKFSSRVVDTTSVADIPAVIPEVTGRAWITGTSQVGVHPDDPFPNGFSMETLADGSVLTNL